MASTKHGGYSSKAAQSSALASAMRASQAKYPGAWAKAGTTANSLLQQKAANQARAQQQAKQAQQQRLHQARNPKITFTKPNFSKIIKPKKTIKRLSPGGCPPNAYCDPSMNLRLKPKPKYVNPNIGSNGKLYSSPEEAIRNNPKPKPKSIPSIWDLGISNRGGNITKHYVGEPIEYERRVDNNPKIAITNLQGNKIETGDSGLIRTPNGGTDIIGMDKRSPAYKKLMKGDVLLKGMKNTSKNPTSGEVSTLGQMAITDNYSIGGFRNLVPKRNKPKILDESIVDVQPKFNGLIGKPGIWPLPIQPWNFSFKPKYKY